MAKRAAGSIVESAIEARVGAGGRGVGKGQRSGNGVADQQRGPTGGIAQFGVELDRVSHARRGRKIKAHAATGKQGGVAQNKRRIRGSRASRGDAGEGQQQKEGAKITGPFHLGEKDELGQHFSRNDWTWVGGCFRTRPWQSKNRP